MTTALDTRQPLDALLPDNAPMTSMGALGGMDAGGHGHAHGHAHAGPQTNVVTMVHRLLRGRYVVAVVLGVIGAAAGAFGGFKFAQSRVLFEGAGLVHVQSTTPNLMNNNTSTLPMFQSFVSTQATMLTQPRVLNKAMNSPEWTALGRGVGAEQEKKFKDALKIVNNRDSMELIQVSFMDTDPRAAMIGLNAVINAYKEVAGNDIAKGVSDTQINVLENSRTALVAQLANDRRSLQNIAKKYGTDNLDKFVENAEEEMFNLEKSVNELRNKLIALGVTVPSDGVIADAPKPDAKPGDANDPKAVVAAPKAPETKGPTVLEPRDIALQDPTMAQLLHQRMSLENDMDRYTNKGFGKNNLNVQRVQADIDALNNQINKYAIEWNQSHASANGLAITPQTETLAQMTDRYKRMQRQLQELRQRTLDMGNTRIDLESYKHDIEDHRNQLANLQNRLDELSNQKLMNQAIGRIEYILADTAPSSPAVDNRVKFAAAGLVVGGGLPIALVALLGLLDRRFRYSDQAHESGTHIPLLGILPQLPRDLHDPEQTMAAAHCVHQMRTILQIGGMDRKVYAVTSSTAGDGKTSLALSLGISFAAAGSRTLLIDFDLIGRGLTNNLKLRGEQGMADVFRSGNAAAAVLPTKISRLYLLPSAAGDDRFVSKLAKPMVEDLIRSLRDKYDVIIVDTGPILGSLEAHFISAVADGVVLVVGRGQHQAQVRRASDLLLKIGANVVGFVFNRAYSGDFSRSNSSQSVRSLSAGKPLEPVRTPPPELAGELDPLSATVAIDVAD